MKRREFIALMGGAAVAWPHAANAQQAGKLPTIGYMGSSTATAQQRSTRAFVQRLRELGWIEDRTVAIDYRWAEGQIERFSEIAAEFVRFKVDVIFTTGAGAAVAKEATSVIPIVFTLAQDPIGSGLVASLARPGGNVTGLSNQQADLAGKRIELLRNVVPSIRRLAILANVGNAGAALDMREAQAAASKLGLHVVTSAIRRAEDFARAFEAIEGRADALYVCGDLLQGTYRLRINTLALGLRLPTMLSSREDAEAAGLMSYGPNYPDLYRRAAELVDKILQGAKPADLPVEQPTKFDLIINLTTAKALGLAIPEPLLLRADEVIERGGASSSRYSAARRWRGRSPFVPSKVQLSYALAFSGGATPVSARPTDRQGSLTCPQSNRGGCALLLSSAL
jgi:putative ABC transport system substrate-binding protein